MIPNTKTSLLTIALMCLGTGMIETANGEKQKHLTLCKKTISKETHQLKAPAQMTPLTLRKNAFARLTTYPDVLKVGISRRSQWYHHCSGAFQNNPCTTKTAHFPLSRLEVLTWEKDKVCQIGFLCEPYGECWGSTADRCLSDWREKNVETREHTWLGQEWLVRWRDSCISSWECLVEIAYLPLLVGPGSGDHDELTTFDGKDKEIKIKKKDWKAPIQASEGMQVHILEDPWNKTVEEQETSCLLRKDNSISCIWQKKGSTGGIPFLVDHEKYQSFFRNMKLQVLRIDAIDEWGKMSSLGPEESQNVPPIMKDFSKLGKAASVEDLKEMLMEMSYRQLEIETNLYIERENRMSIERKFTTLVESVSKLDDELVPALLDIQARTEWVNEKTFKIHPCLNKTFSEDTNCDIGTVFAKGRRRIAKEGDFCYSTDSSARKSINLFNDSEIRFDSLRRSEPFSTAEEWDGWSSIDGFGKDIMKSVATDVHSSDDDGSKPVGSLIPSWVLGSSIMSYVALGLSILSLLITGLRK